MVIYGVAILSFCYLAGQLLGEILGKLMGVQANVGGVGFAMLLLILLNSWLEKSGYFKKETEEGIQFWSQMYIPIIIAMAATQNVKLAFSSGMVAILVGIIPAFLCFLAIPLISKFANHNPDSDGNTPKVH